MLAGPDPQLEGYYPRDGPGKRPECDRLTGLSTTLSLRGGGVDEDRDRGPQTPEARDGTDEGETGLVSLRGGGIDWYLMSHTSKELHAKHGTAQPPSRWSATDVFKTPLHTPLGGERAAEVAQRWIPLYGYQGVVWFRIDLFYTFVDAVDRLLCLDNRAGVTYSLYLLDKNKQYRTQAERDGFLRDVGNNGLTLWCSGAGDYSHDHLAWEWAVERLGKLGEGENGDPEVYSKVLFVAGPGDPIPWTWEPDPSHRVQKVVLDWASVPRMDRPDVAYLRMPENPRDAAFANQYGPWVANVCRVLAAGRIPGRPGCPAIPDAWFTLKGRGRGTTGVAGTYGGLCALPQLWDAIVSEWERDPSAMVTLEARTGPQHGKRQVRISDRWHLFLPGLDRPYEKQYILHSEVDDAECVRQRIMGLVKDSMSEESFAQISSLEVYLPGTGFLVASEDPADLVISMTANDQGPAFKQVVDRMTHWKQWLESLPGAPPAVNGLSLFPQFVTIRPVFKSYSISDASQGGHALQWNPSTTSVAEFRRLASKVLSRGGQKQPYAPANSWLGITQSRPREGSAKTKGHPGGESKPRLLVGPQTSEHEWKSIRRMIVEPEVFVSLVDEQSLPRKRLQPRRACLSADVRFKGFGDSNSEQPFGYRDIYRTPSSLLYQALDKDKIPASGRYYDWQLWGEDVTSQLKTVRPWEEQPEPLSRFYGHDDFPLQLPPSGGSSTVGSASRKQTKGPGTDTRRPQNGSMLQVPSSQSVARSLPQGVNFRVVADAERGQRPREYSYANPLNVQMSGATPVNAPPADTLLNLGHDSVPVISLSVLTPTEVRRLQRDHYNMRNLILSRSERCPYPDCDAIYPADQPSAMQQHLEDKHVAEKCNFCDEVLFRHWPPEQRYQHLVLRHSDILQSLLTQPRDDEVDIPAEPRTDGAREGRWRFCARCGRDHTVLNARPDRAHHDSVCYPGVQDGEPDWVACGTCGDRIPETLPGRPGAGHRHVQGKGAGPGGAPYCEQCGLSLGHFSEGYRKKHASFCKGHGRDNAKYCPWCGVQLDPGFAARARHIEECNWKPSDHAEGPIDVLSWSYFLPTIRHTTTADSKVPEDEGQASQQASQQAPTRERGRISGAAARKPHEAAEKLPSKTSAPSPPLSREQSMPAADTGRPKPSSSASDPPTTAKRRPSIATTSSSLSSPASSTHSGRSSESWRPRPKTPPAPPTPAPAPAAAAAAAKQPADSKAKTATAGRKTQKQQRRQQQQQQTRTAAATTARVTRARAAARGTRRKRGGGEDNVSGGGDEEGGAGAGARAGEREEDESGRAR